MDQRDIKESGLSDLVVPQTYRSINRDPRLYTVSGQSDRGTIFLTITMLVYADSSLPENAYFAYFELVLSVAESGHTLSGLNTINQNAHTLTVNHNFKIDATEKQRNG